MNRSINFKTITIAAAICVLFTFQACNSGENVSGYSTSSNGLDYKIITDSNQPKAKVGDYVQYYSTIRTTKDSVIFSLNNSKTSEIGQVSAPKEKGDPIEILTLLGKGDSASCLISAETFFKTEQLPPPLKKGDRIKLDIKIIDVFAQAEFDAKLAEIENQKLLLAESAAINYIKANNIQAQRLPSGMYYVVENPGSGVQPENNKNVKVNYHGTLFDGTVFDSSLKPGREPFEFILGRGQVIKGWDQGIPLFKVGGKGKLIIPPSMGYGEQGQGSIPPNSWLVFDIEVLGVSDAPQKQGGMPMQ